MKVPPLPNLEDRLYWAHRRANGYANAIEDGWRDGYAAGFAAALGMIAPKCNCGCIHTDYECVKCAVLKRAAASALAE